MGNKIQCLSCLDIIESLHVHHMVWCKCGSIALDGGDEYQKVSFKEGCEWIPVPSEDD